jgi:endoglucanase
MVILNNHISSAGWCCSEKDGEGLWWTDTYPENVWFQHLTLLANTYRQYEKVIGFDLRN